MRKIAFIMLGSLLLGVLLVPLAHASEFRTGKTVHIAEGETVEDDLYVSAEEVIIDGVVRGDLIAAASKIVINGSVEGDFFGAAQDVIINGRVERDAWAAGQNILIRGGVGDDLRAAGMVITLDEGSVVGDSILAGCYALELRSGSDVGGDLNWSSGIAGLAGEIGGNVGGTAGGIEISGRIKGNVKITVEEKEKGEKGPPPWVFAFASGVSIPSIPAGLHITEDTRIDGSLTYISTEEASISSTAYVAGGITREAPEVSAVEKAPEARLGSPQWLLGRLRYLLGLLVVGFLLGWAVPRRLEDMTRFLSSRPLASFGWGIVMVVAVPAAGLILAALVAIVGLVVKMVLGELGTAILIGGFVSVGVLFTLYFLAIAYLSKVVVGLWAGRMVLGRIWPSQAEALFGPLAAGLCAFVVLNSIPYLGMLFWLLAVIPGLGTILALR